MPPKSQFSADLVAFTKEILNGKLRFLCSEKIAYKRFQNINGENRKW